MYKYVIIVVGCALAVGFSTPVLATPITIPNHSFETTLASTPPTPPRAASWAILSPTQFSLLADSSLLASGTAPDGDRVLATVNVILGTGYVYNVADELLKANTRYTVQVDVGRPLPGYSIPNSLGAIPLTPAGYRVDVGTIPGNVDLASDVNSLVTPSGGFVTAKLTFDIPNGDPRIGQALYISLGALHGDNQEAYTALFDNVRIDAVAIPEPASIWLACCAFTGLVALCARRRR